MKLHKNIPFTVAPNELIQDNEMSAQARFIYVYMASKPDNWEFYMGPLATQLQMNIKTLRKYMAELESRGWLTNEGQINHAGKFGSNRYTIHATPCTKFCPTGKNYRAVNFTVRQNLRDAKIGAHIKERVLQKKDIVIQKKEEERKVEILAAVENEFSKSENKKPDSLPISQPDAGKEKKVAPKKEKPKSKPSSRAALGRMREQWMAVFPDYIWQDQDSRAAESIYYALRDQMSRRQSKEFGFGVKVPPEDIHAEWQHIVSNLPGWITEKSFAEVPFILKKINSIRNEIKQNKLRSNQPAKGQTGKDSGKPYVTGIEKYLPHLAGGS